MKPSRKSIFSSGVLVIAFLSFFLSAYKYSDLKGLRRLVVAFKIAIFLMVSPLSPANAKDSEFLPGSEGFTPPRPPLSRLAPNNPGYFGSKTTGSSSSGEPKKSPDNNSGDDPSNTPFSDYETNPDLKENRPESKNFKHYIHEKISEDNSDDESEKQCAIEEIKVGIANDGTFINILDSQVRDKGLHIPDFLDAETLDGKFDVSEADNLEYSDRLNYLRDKNNLPDDIVFQARDEILDFMTAVDTKLIPGFLGKSKIEGTVFINLRLNKVGFRDNGSYKFRTAMTMNDKKIKHLAKTDFHLFPNSGKQ
jgi:hypothetical protein